MGGMLHRNCWLPWAGTRYEVRISQDCTDRRKSGSALRHARTCCASCRNTVGAQMRTGVVQGSRASHAWALWLNGGPLGPTHCCPPPCCSPVLLSILPTVQPKASCSMRGWELPRVAAFAAGCFGWRATAPGAGTSAHALTQVNRSPRVSTGAAICRQKPASALHNISCSQAKAPTKIYFPKGNKSAGRDNGCPTTPLHCQEETAIHTR